MHGRGIGTKPSTGYDTDKIGKQAAAGLASSGQPLLVLHRAAQIVCAIVVMLVAHSGNLESPRSSLDLPRLS